MECGDHHPVCRRYQSAAELLGRRWSLAVIRVALDGPARFGQFRSSVEGLSARLLTERLRELEEVGVFEKVQVAPRSYAYRLTAKGEALAVIVAELETWANAWE